MATVCSQIPRQIHRISRRIYIPRVPFFIFSPRLSTLVLASPSYYSRPSCIERRRDAVTHFRKYSTNPDKNTNQRPSEKIIRFIGWLGGFNSKKEVMKRSSISIYKKCIDDVDYESFMKAASLPDTLHSWFLIAHLHLWLCMVRLKREGKDGSFIIYHLFSFFWEDARERMKAMGVTSKISKNLQELDSLSRGLIVAYEEGLLTNDRKFASSFWRNWVSDKANTDPVVLCALVNYAREQVKVMDSSKSEELLMKGVVNINELVIEN